MSVRLDAEARAVLDRLLIHEERGLAGHEVQGQVPHIWPIRPVLDSLRRRKLIESDGNRDLVMRRWWITDAGKAALG